METSTLTSKGQILIPKRIRLIYSFIPGDKVIFMESSEGVLIRPMNKTFFKSFKGILKSTGNLKNEIKKYKAEEMLLEEKMDIRKK